MCDVGVGVAILSQEDYHMEASIYILYAPYNTGNRFLYFVGNRTF